MPQEDYHRMLTELKRVLDGPLAELVAAAEHDAYNAMTLASRRHADPEIQYRIQNAVQDVQEIGVALERAQTAVTTALSTVEERAGSGSEGD